MQTRPGGYLVAADADEPRPASVRAARVRGTQPARGVATRPARERRSWRRSRSGAARRWRSSRPSPFARAELARLDGLHAGALEARIEADLALGAHDALVPELEAVVARYPLREQLRGPVDARAVPLRPAGRGAAGVPRRAERARGRARDRAGPDAAGARAGDPPPGSVPRPRHARGTARSARGRRLRRTRPRGRRALGRARRRQAGRGRLFLVSGESGLGKTRLADEVASRAKDAGLRVLWGRSAKAEGAPAYWLWSQALRPLDAELPELDPAKTESARFQLFVDVASALRAASAAQPVFLVLDDLHHADEPSLLLLDFLAGELAEMHLAVVGDVRRGRRDADAARGARRSFRAPPPSAPAARRRRRRAPRRARRCAPTWTPPPCTPRRAAIRASSGSACVERVSNGERRRSCTAMYSYITLRSMKSGPRPRRRTPRAPRG